MFTKIIFAICINLALWEVFIRIFISSPCTQLADNELGYMNIPHAPFVYSSEGYSRGRFNSLGFNDDEPLRSLGEIKRIFIVGDSYTESFQVPRGNSYVQLLENKLNDTRREKQVDTIKIARDGFGPAHYPVVINRFMDTFQPDLIVLQFWAHSGGDLYAENIECEYDQLKRITSLQVKPQFEDRGKEELRFVINNSALMYHVLRRYKPIIMKFVKRFSLYGSEVDKKNKKDQDHKTNRSLLDMSRRIAYILDQIMANGSEVVVFYIPAPGIFFDGTIPLTSDTLKALRAATAELNIQFIDLTENFKKYYINQKQPVNGFINSLPGKGHLNARGHRLVAAALAQNINHQQVFK